MVAKNFALARAAAWRERSLVWTRTRDRAAHRGYEDPAAYAQREADCCHDRACRWQSLADGPMWQRWLRPLPADYPM